MNEQTISFNVEAWMGLTGCSEIQAIISAASHLNTQNPQASGFAWAWGVEGPAGDQSVLDYMETRPGEPGEYEFVYSPEGDLVDEGWVD